MGKKKLDGNTTVEVYENADGSHTNLARVGNVRSSRESFELSPADNSNWDFSIGAGDIVLAGGSAGGASYNFASKSAWAGGNETTITSKERFEMPVDLSFGVHLSQRTLGQEFSVELVDEGEELPPFADIAIASLSQTTTVVTANTVTDHGLSVGDCMGIADSSDCRYNYPSLVVTGTPTPRQVTLAGEGAAIASLTLGDPAGTKGVLYRRERMGRAKNGMSQIFQNATATNAGLYVRSEKGDVLPSGTINGNQSDTVGTTASVQSINSAYNYAFDPTTEFFFSMMANAVQWFDVPVDSTAQPTPRRRRSKVVPDPKATYKLRFRLTNNRSLTGINASVISVVKSGSTTATFRTKQPHGLITGDLINFYGSNSNIAADAPNLTAATAVTVSDANTFTAVIGSGTSGSFFGGYVAKINGSILMSANGASAITAINATLTTLTDGQRQLVLTGSGNWTGLLIGDMVEAAGIRSSIVDPAGDLGVDGSWMVANIATNVLTLVPPKGATAFIAALPADFGLTVCGGGIVKRTCFRNSFVRISDFERLRVEMSPRPSGDSYAGFPVNVQNAITAAISGAITAVTTLSNGQAAHDAVIAGSPLRGGARALSANYPAVASGDTADLISTLVGALITKPFSIPELDWQASVALTTNVASALQAAAGAGLKRYTTGVMFQNKHASVASEVQILRGSTVIWGPFSFPANSPPFFLPLVGTPLQTAANEALNVQALTTGSNIQVAAVGFTGP